MDISFYMTKEALAKAVCPPREKRLLIGVSLPASELDKFENAKAYPGLTVYTCFVQDPYLDF